MLLTLEEPKPVAGVVALVETATWLLNPNPTPNLKPIPYEKCWVILTHVWVKYGKDFHGRWIVGYCCLTLPTVQLKKHLPVDKNS